MKKYAILALTAFALGGCAPAFTPEQLTEACEQIYPANKRVVFDAILDSLDTHSLEADFDTGIIKTRTDATAFIEALFGDKREEEIMYIVLGREGSTKVRIQVSEHTDDMLGQSSYSTMTPEICNQIHDNIRAKSDIL